MIELILIFFDKCNILKIFEKFLCENLFLKKIFKFRHLYLKVAVMI